MCFGDEFGDDSDWTWLRIGCLFVGLVNLFPLVMGHGGRSLDELLRKGCCEGGRQITLLLTVILSVLHSVFSALLLIGATCDIMWLHIPFVFSCCLVALNIFVGGFWYANAYESSQYGQIIMDIVAFTVVLVSLFWVLRAMSDYKSLWSRHVSLIPRRISQDLRQLQRTQKRERRRQLKALKADEEKAISGATTDEEEASSGGGGGGGARVPPTNEDFAAPVLTARDNRTTAANRMKNKPEKSIAASTLKGKNKT